MTILIYVINAHLAEEPECACALGHTYLLHIPSHVLVLPEKKKECGQLMLKHYTHFRLMKPLYVRQNHRTAQAGKDLKRSSGVT